MVADDLTVTSRAGVVVVAGEIDISNAPVLDEHLSAVDGTLELDLTGVTFLGSAGINLLVQQLRRRGQRSRPHPRHVADRASDVGDHRPDRSLRRRGPGVGPLAVGRRRLTQERRLPVVDECEHLFVHSGRWRR